MCRRSATTAAVRASRLTPQQRHAMVVHRRAAAGAGAGMGPALSGVAGGARAAWFVWLEVAGDGAVGGGHFVEPAAGVAVDGGGLGHHADVVAAGELGLVLQRGQVNAWLVSIGRFPGSGGRSVRGRFAGLVAANARA